MSIFFHILLNNIAPIFIIIFLGYLLTSKFHLDIVTMSKMTFYIFVPSLIFVKVYQTEINLELLTTILFAFLMIIGLELMGWVVSKIRNYDLAKANALKNSIIFYNAANFGLPLIMLMFNGTSYETYAVSIQIMVLMVQSLTSYTLGFYHAGMGQMSPIETIRKIFSMPSVYAIIAGLILKYLPLDLTDLFFWPSIEFMKNGLVPIVLLSLGTQLYHSEISFGNKDVYLASFLRLLGGPLLALLLIKLMGISGVMAQVLFISSAVPSAVNTALIAVEFNNEPDFASQIVITSTLLSSITLTGIIILAQAIFA